MCRSNGDEGFTKEDSSMTYPRPRSLIRAIAIACLFAAALVSVSPTKAAQVRQSDLNRLMGHAMALYHYGSESAWGCIDYIVMRESAWSHTADNPSSSAYGIPQALPGRKMASEAPDWRTSPVTQTWWMFRYVDGRYGGPCKAAAFKRRNGWY